MEHKYFSRAPDFTKTNVLDKINLPVITHLIIVCDSRCPASSFPWSLYKQYFKTKKIICILSKSDLADTTITKNWQTFFRLKKITCAIFSVKNPKLSNLIITKLKPKNINNSIVISAIIGMPNVGKTTLLNVLVKKNVGITANFAGVTKKLGCFKLGTNFFILDTPGTINHDVKQYHLNSLYKLMACQIIPINLNKDTHRNDLFIYLWETIIFPNFPKLVQKCFGLNFTVTSNWEETFSNFAIVKKAHNYSKDKFRIFIWQKFFVTPIIPYTMELPNFSNN